MATPMSLQSTISEAVQAPYSLFSGPQAPTSSSFTSSYFSSRGGTEYPENDDKATSLPKRLGHEPEDDASANGSVLTSDSTLKTTPQQQGRSTAGLNSESLQRAEILSTHSRDGNDARTTANETLTLRKSAFGRKLPRSPSLPKGRPGRLNSPESGSNSASRSPLRSAGAWGVSFDPSSAVGSHASSSSSTGARPSTVH